MKSEDKILLSEFLERREGTLKEFLEVLLTFHPHFPLVSGISCLWGTVARAVVRGCTPKTSSCSSTTIGRICFSFCSNLVIKRVEVFSSGAVYIEPPVTYKVLLLEECSIRTEEGVLGETTTSIIGTDMECLTFCLHISIISSIHLTITSERSFRNLTQDWIILPRGAWNCLL